MEDKTIIIYDLDHVQDYDLVAEDIHPVHDQDQDRHTTNPRRQGVSCPWRRIYCYRRKIARALWPRTHTDLTEIENKRIQEPQEQEY